MFFKSAYKHDDLTHVIIPVWVGEMTFDCGWYLCHVKVVHFLDSMPVLLAERLDTARAATIIPCGEYDDLSQYMVTNTNRYSQLWIKRQEGPEGPTLLTWGHWFKLKSINFEVVGIESQCYFNSTKLRVPRVGANFDFGT